MGRTLASGVLLVECDFVDTGIAGTGGFAGERRHVTFVLMLFGEGANQVGAWFEAPDAIEAAIIGAGAAGYLRGAGVAVGDDVVFQDADIILVDDNPADRSEARQADVQESGGGFLENDGDAGAVVLFLAILHGGKAATGGGDEIGSGGQGSKFERARVVGAGGLDGSGRAGDRSADDQRLGERLAGLVLHDDPANYRGCAAAVSASSAHFGISSDGMTLEVRETFIGVASGVRNECLRHGD